VETPDPPTARAAHHRTGVLTHNAHDAEDAFQATFLVLVRKAATLRSPGMVGNWLYGVTCRTALEAPFEAYVLARSSAMARKSPVDPARIVQWANQAVASGNQAWYLHVLGLAQYRAGQLDQAHTTHARFLVHLCVGPFSRNPVTSAVGTGFESLPARAESPNFGTQWQVLSCPIRLAPCETPDAPTRPETWAMW
jgi:hypothetical protein